jgi:hypothetical protein
LLCFKFDFFGNIYFGEKNFSDMANPDSPIASSEMLNDHSDSSCESSDSSSSYKSDWSVCTDCDRRPYNCAEFHEANYERRRARKEQKERENKEQKERENKEQEQKSDELKQVISEKEHCVKMQLDEPSNVLTGM